MAQNIFKGLGIALVTPFKTDGSVDYEAIERLVEYQLDNGADFLCILATTGETPCLTEEEKGRIKQLIVEQVRGRVPILMGCGGNNTAAVVNQLREGDFKGIDGVLSVCPYYNKPSQEGLYRHFKAIAEASRLPVVLYNVPGRTGVLMKAETTCRLAHDCDNIVAIKEASGSLELVDEIIKHKPAEFDIISGDVVPGPRLLGAPVYLPPLAGIDEPPHVANGVGYVAGAYRDPLAGGRAVRLHVEGHYGVGVGKVVPYLNRTRARRHGHRQVPHRRYRGGRDAMGTLRVPPGRHSRRTLWAWNSTVRRELPSGLL